MLVKELQASIATADRDEAVRRSSSNRFLSTGDSVATDVLHFSAGSIGMEWTHAEHKLCEKEKRTAMDWTPIGLAELRTCQQFPA